MNTAFERVFIVFFATYLASPILAAKQDVGAENQAAKVESVLDKLERKFLDREAGALTYDEASPQKKPEEIKTVDSVDIKKREPIRGKTPNQKTLDAIQEKINEYEAQVDLIEADTRKMKSDLIEKSSSSNLLSLEAKLTNPKLSSLKSLTVRIDGSLIFNQIDHSGIWMPGSSVSLYHGPVQPGDHSVEIKAVLNKVQESGMPMAGWTSQEITKKYTINIPAGSVTKSVVISLDVNGEKQGQASATLNESIDMNLDKREGVQ